MGMTITNFETCEQIVVLCDLCFQEITNVTRIKCECKVDICINCFYDTGKKYSEKYPNDIQNVVSNDMNSFSSNSMFKSTVLKKHTPLHRYYCVEPMNFTILDPSWTALEELIFFEMLVTHGIG